MSVSPFDLSDSRTREEIMVKKSERHMVPLTDVFRSKYEPSEVRFLGDPTDLYGEEYGIV